jgi:hypothetical protein
MVGSSLLIKKEEKITVIDNLSLLENMHNLRLKDLVLGIDFIIVPRFMFFPLSKWYGCNKVIERRVISYQRDRNQAINILKSKKSQSNRML